MLLRASDLEASAPSDSTSVFSFPWFRGRLAVVGGLGALSYAGSLLVEAQAAQETPVWISAHAAPVYPPDLSCCGVRCGVLPFVQVNDVRAAFEAAEICLRSEAFGFIVLDLPPAQELRESAPARLARIAERQGCAVLLLCDNAEHYPGGPLVSLRIAVERQPLKDGSFLLELQVLKDKHSFTRTHTTRVLHGPDGLY